jgi:hypothetical protein
VTSDAYSAGWAEQEWRSHGIAFVKADQDKSKIYLSALALLASGNARLLDNPRLFNQIVNLNRECAKGGRDTVIKQRGSFDDSANAALGALVYCQVRAKRPVGSRQLRVEGAGGAYYA